jgi:uracil permease
MMLSVFVATVLIGNICGVDTGAVLVGAGLATLINILVTKGGSPMFMSSSGAFVAPILLALSLAGYGGVLIGCFTTCIVYCIFGFIFSRIDVDKIYKVFPRALIGAITAVIGINLMPFILTYV